MFEEFIHLSTKAIEISGVLVIIGGALFATYHYLIHCRRNTNEGYETFRKQLGRSILLGLELLVAADIIATVAARPSMDRVLTLGLIVIIRTFLSFSLEIELEGKLPWRQKS